jgi:hypothetical protein
VAFPVLFDGRRLDPAEDLEVLGASSRRVLEELVAEADDRGRWRRALGPRRVLFGRLRRWWIGRRAKEVLG